MIPLIYMIIQYSLKRHNCRSFQKMQLYYSFSITVENTVVKIYIMIPLLLNSTLTSTELLHCLGPVFWLSLFVVNNVLLYWWILPADYIIAYFDDIFMIIVRLIIANLWTCIMLFHCIFVWSNLCSYSHKIQNIDTSLLKFEVNLQQYAIFLLFWYLILF